MNDVKAEEIHQRIDDPSMVLVNVLNEAEFQRARIPRSLNLPLSDLRARVATVLPDRNADIVVYCAGGT